MPRPKKGERTPGSGRPVGRPNKVTADARRAIAEFVDGNAHRLTEWLDAVANGDPSNDIPPDPAKAFSMFQSIVEYHVPKLARQENTGAEGGPIQIDISWQQSE